MPAILDIQETVSIPRVCLDNVRLVWSRIVDQHIWGTVKLYERRAS